MDDIFTQDDMKQADTMGSLGPHYFSSRRVVEKFMADFDPDLFKPLVDNAVKEIHDTLWRSVEEYLWSDVESNIQSQMWRTVDEIMRGAMSGEKWIVDRYVLGERYDCEKARAAIAKHITDDVAKARIADLEAQVAKLQADCDWYRSR